VTCSAHKDFQENGWSRCMVLNLWLGCERRGGNKWRVAWAEWCGLCKSGGGEDWDAATKGIIGKR
jgi:hypothetical protein